MCRRVGPRCEISFLVFVCVLTTCTFLSSSSFPLATQRKLACKCFLIIKLVNTSSVSMFCLIKGGGGGGVLLHLQLQLQLQLPLRLLLRLPTLIPRVGTKRKLTGLHFLRLRHFVRELQVVVDEGLDCHLRRARRARQRVQVQLEGQASGAVATSTTAKDVQVVVGDVHGGAADAVRQRGMARPFLVWDKQVGAQVSRGRSGKAKQAPAAHTCDRGLYSHSVSVAMLRPPSGLYTKPPTRRMLSLNGTTLGWYKPPAGGRGWKESNVSWEAWGGRDCAPLDTHQASACGRPATCFRPSQTRKWWSA